MERMDFYPLEAHGTRHYIVVAPWLTHRVECVYRGPQETDRNVYAVGEALAGVLGEIIKKYDPAYYDIATVRAHNLPSVKAAVPEFQGWRGVPILPIPLPYAL